MEIEESATKKLKELWVTIETQKTEIVKLTAELSEARDLISYMNNKDRMARDNEELRRRVEGLKKRFRDTAGAMELAIKLSIEPSVEDLSTVVLPDPLPKLLLARYLG